jgi:hypothetical protein
MIEKKMMAELSVMPLPPIQPSDWIDMIDSDTGINNEEEAQDGPSRFTILLSHVGRELEVLQKIQDRLYDNSKQQR